MLQIGGPLDKIELISSEALEARLGQCLKERYMPDYFLYLGGSGVGNWLTLTDAKEFPVASRLTDPLRDSLPAITPHLPGRFDLVSIGVGGGEKERMLLEALASQHAITYVAVDISSEMVDEALNSVAGIDVDKVGVVGFGEDLEVLRQFWNPPVLLCLMGNNFCNYDSDQLLGSVGGQLESCDLFLFDCHLFTAQPGCEEVGKDRIEETYRTELNVRFNIEPLLRRGLGADDCVFHLDLLPSETRLGTVYRTSKRIEILRDTTLSCGSTRVSLAVGDSIRLGFTYKYTEEQVGRYLEQCGFEQVERFLSADGENLLTLVKKQSLSRRAEDGA